MDHKITALKAQKRNPDRVSVYLDGEYAFGVTRIVAAWLQVGQSLSDEKIATLQAAEAREVAFLKALKLLSYRPRSQAELERKLREDEVAEPVIETVIERLRAGGMVNDGVFAHNWVESRVTFHPRGRRVLAMELRQKGISDEIIEQALAETGDENELARQAAEKYARRLQGQDWETFYKRLTGFLIRRGFNYGTAAPIVRDLWDKQGGQSELKSSDYEEV